MSKKKPAFIKDKCRRCDDGALLLDVPYYGLLCGSCVEHYIDRVLFPASVSTNITDMDTAFMDKLYDDACDDGGF